MNQYYFDNEAHAARPDPYPANSVMNNLLLFFINNVYLCEYNIEINQTTSLLR